MAKQALDKVKGSVLPPKGMDDAAPLQAQPDWYQTRGVHSISEQCLQRMAGKELLAKFTSPILNLNGTIKGFVWVETQTALYLINSLGDIDTSVINPPVVIPPTESLTGWYTAEQFDENTQGEEIAFLTDYSGAGLTLGAGGVPTQRCTVDLNSLGSYTSIKCAGDVAIQFGYGTASFVSSGDWSFFIVLRASESTPISRRDFFSFNTLHWCIGIDNNKKLHVHQIDGGEFVTNEIVSTQTWHYIMLVKSGSTLSAYLDGVLLTWVTTPPVEVGNQFVVVGGEGFWAGNVTECGIFNVAIDNDYRMDLEAYVRNKYNLP